MNAASLWYRKMVGLTMAVTLLFAHVTSALSRQPATTLDKVSVCLHDGSTCIRKYYSDSENSDFVTRVNDVCNSELHKEYYWFSVDRYAHPIHSIRNGCQALQTQLQQHVNSTDKDATWIKVGRAWTSMEKDVNMLDVAVACENNRRKGSLSSTLPNPLFDFMVAVVIGTITVGIGELVRAWVIYPIWMEYSGNVNDTWRRLLSMIKEIDPDRQIKEEISKCLSWRLDNELVQEGKQPEDDSKWIYQKILEVVNGASKPADAFRTDRFDEIINIIRDHVFKVIERVPFEYFKDLPANSKKVPWLLMVQEDRDTAKSALRDFVVQYLNVEEFKRSLSVSLRLPYLRTESMPSHTNPHEPTSGIRGHILTGRTFSHSGDVKIDLSDSINMLKVAISNFCQGIALPLGDIDSALYVKFSGALDNLIRDYYLKIFGIHFKTERSEEVQLAKVEGEESAEISSVTFEILETLIKSTRQPSTLIHSNCWVHSVLMKATMMRLPWYARYFDLVKLVIWGVVYFVLLIVAHSQLQWTSMSYFSYGLVSVVLLWFLVELIECFWETRLISYFKQWEMHLQGNARKEEHLQLNTGIWFAVKSAFRRFFPPKDGRRDQTSREVVEGKFALTDPEDLLCGPRDKLPLSSPISEQIPQILRKNASLVYMLIGGIVTGVTTLLLRYVNAQWKSECLAMCKDSYYPLDNTTVEACVRCDKPGMVLFENICQCASPYFQADLKNAERHCAVCINDHRDMNKNCSCLDTFDPIGDECQCLHGKTIIGGKCVCEFNLFFSNATQNCVTCDSNNRDASTIPGECGLCKAGFDVDERNICVSVDGKRLCDPLFKVANNDGTCGECKGDNRDPTDCTKCLSGYVTDKESDPLSYCALPETKEELYEDDSAKVEGKPSGTIARTKPNVTAGKKNDANLLTISVITISTTVMTLLLTVI